MRKFVWVRHLLWILAFALIPMVFLLSTLIPDSLTVMRTGICPGAPPDIPAYPCTLFEFWERQLFGPFAILGFFLVYIIWTFSGFPLLCLGYIWWVRKQKQVQAED